MNETQKKVCNAVEDILKYNLDVLVSAKEILDILKREFRFPELSYDELAHYLKKDVRFEFYDIIEDVPQSEGLSDEIISKERMKIEALGFYSGPRVKLKYVTLDMEKIVVVLNRKVDLMMDVLINIWNKRPKDDENLEDNLLDILSKAQKMQREIKDVINTDKLKVLTDFFKSKSENL